MAILPDNTKKLGFGLMRLPIVNGNSECIDLEQVNRMTDHFLAQGYTYFDTAYPYHMGFSERAVKSALVERHPRDSFLLADKMPIFRVSKPEDAPAAFAEQLERTGAGYFDFYLLHAMSADRLKTVLDCQVWTYLLGEKAQGRIRRLGFSFHDTPEVLETILNTLPEAEFVQLQINYADWEDEEVQARRCYEVAQKHGKPVIVMEPIRGGSTASESGEPPGVDGVLGAALCRRSAGRYDGPFRHVHLGADAAEHGTVQQFAAALPGGEGHPGAGCRADP